MIHYKSEKEIEVMRKGGKILSDVIWEVIENVKPGVTELELEKIADRLIVEKGGAPAFKEVDDYKFATCISTNNVVVHGIPTEYKLRKGDIIGIDCGVFYEGFNTDMSESVVVGVSDKKDLDPEIEKAIKFLITGKKALNEAIKVAVTGNRIGDISKTIQKIIEEDGGYSIVRSLIGHGVGKKLHEDPEVPGFLDRDIKKTSVLKPGMTIAIEIIYNMGEADVSFYNKDGWTIGSSDGSISGLFERTVAITEKGTEVITK